MNDISVKIVESPRDQVPGSPSTLAGADTELDPLAITEGDAALTKDSLAKEVTTTVENPQEIEKKGACDDDAKEKILNESPNEEKDKILTEQTEDIKGILDKNYKFLGLHTHKTELSLIAVTTKLHSKPQASLKSCYKLKALTKKPCK